MGFYISDHAFVTCLMRAEKPGRERKDIRFGNIKSIDQSAMKNDLQNFVDGCTEVHELNELINNYEAGLRSILNKHAPMKIREITVRPYRQWYDSSLRIMKKAMRKAECKWVKNRNEVDLNEFKQLRCSYNKKIRSLKYSFTKSKIKTRDSKKFFKVVYQLINNTKLNPLPPGSKEEVAESFSIYFVGKIEKIRRELDSCDEFEPKMKEVVAFESFQEISVHQLKGFIMDSNTTDCYLDPFPTKLIKQFIDVLLPIILKIINLSLSTGHFPSNWKEALIIPLLKTCGLELVNKSYRPVSNLQSASKITEKAALSSFKLHLNESKLLPGYQFAYRKDFSTEMPLPKYTVICSWQWTTKKYLFCSLGFICCF